MIMLVSHVWYCASFTDTAFEDDPEQDDSQRFHWQTVRKVRYIGEMLRSRRNSGLLGVDAASCIAACMCVLQFFGTSSPQFLSLLMELLAAGHDPLMHLSSVHTALQQAAAAKSRGTLKESEKKEIREMEYPGSAEEMLDELRACGQHELANQLQQRWEQAHEQRVTTFQARLQALL
jgi:hypothetical protein